MQGNIGVCQVGSQPRHSKLTVAGMDQVLGYLYKQGVLQGSGLSPLLSDIGRA